MKESWSSKWFRHTFSLRSDLQKIMKPCKNSSRRWRSKGDEEKRETNKPQQEQIMEEKEFHLKQALVCSDRETT